VLFIQVSDLMQASTRLYRRAVDGYDMVTEAETICTIHCLTMRPL